MRSHPLAGPRADSAQGTGIRGVGWLAAGAAVALGIYFVVSSPTLGGVRACLVIWLVAWCAWAVLIRPRVDVEDDVIVLIGSVRDVRIPAARVDAVRVRAYLELVVGRRRYTSAAIGFRPSSLARGHADLARGMVTEGRRRQVESPTAYAAEYLRSVVAQAQARGGEAAPITASVAWIPLGSLLGLVLAAVAAFAL